MKDEEFAANIGAAASQLNMEIEKANQVGLKVEIDISYFQQFQDRHSKPRVNPIVSRVITK